MARIRARKERSKATLNLLAAACERYWTVYHDYPYPNPDYVGLAALGGFPDYKDGTEWSDLAQNVALVYLLSKPRHPEPMVSIRQAWFRKIPEEVQGPDGRPLYKVVDGFDTPIKVVRPYKSASHYVETYMRLISAGPDEKFDDEPKDEEDNEEVYIKR